MAGTLKETPSQTAGPYVHIGLAPSACGIATDFADLGGTMINDKTRGERITITGVVFDGGKEPLGDCVVEIWQADADGIYPGDSDPRGPGDPAFAGWGRMAADSEDGTFRIETIKPGPVPHPGGGQQAPHLNLWIVARGINIGLNTRLYFDDEPDANAADPILGRIDPPARAKTLIARREGDVFTLDIFLQGENETVFFDI